MDQEPLPPNPPFVDYARHEPPLPGAGMATASLVLGIIGLLFWLCPIVGLPIGIVGLVLGIQANKSMRRGSATAGIIMSIICLALSIGNAAWGAYMGATGQHQLINMFNQKMQQQASPPPPSGPGQNPTTHP